MPIWMCAGASLYEEQIKREMVGRSNGVSIRIAKGVYYRTSGFRGYPVETTITKQLSANGRLILTTKNIYYQSTEKSVRLPYNKIVAYDSYSDAIGIHKEGANPKPILIKGIDGCLVYNMVMNIPNIES